MCKKSQAQTRVESQTYNTYHQEHLWSYNAYKEDLTWMVVAIAYFAEFPLRLWCLVNSISILFFFGLCFYFFYSSFPFSFGSWEKWIQNLMIFIQHLNYLSIITILVAWLESFWPNHIWWTTCSLLETFIREP